MALFFAAVSLAAAAFALLAALVALVAAAVLLLAAFVSLVFAAPALPAAALAEDAEAVALSLLYKAQLFALWVLPVVLAVSAAPSGEVVDVAHAFAVFACVPAFCSLVFAALADVAAAVSLDFTSVLVAYVLSA